MYKKFVFSLPRSPSLVRLHSYLGETSWFQLPSRRFWVNFYSVVGDYTTREEKGEEEVMIRCSQSQSRARSDGRAVSISTGSPQEKVKKRRKKPYIERHDQTQRMRAQESWNMMEDLWVGTTQHHGLLFIGTFMAKIKVKYLQYAVVFYLVTSVSGLIQRALEKRLSVALKQL